MARHISIIVEVPDGQDIEQYSERIESLLLENDIPYDFELSTQGPTHHDNGRSFDNVTTLMSELGWAQEIGGTVTCRRMDAQFDNWEAAVMGCVRAATE